jgi:hypothetical protein
VEYNNYDNPDRRPFWDNIQTNEQHFGLLSFDPDTEQTQLKIDGDPSDWEGRSEKPIHTTNEENPIKDVYISSDSRGLYLRIDYDEAKWKKGDFQTSILLDTIKKQGQSTIPEAAGLTEKGIDFIVEIKDEDTSRVLIDSYYDTFYYHYGHLLEMIPTHSYANKKNNGVYHQIRLTLNKELSINKLEDLITVPFSAYETGKLLYGNGNPESKEFNSLADFYSEDGIVEIRLPWLLLNVKDPSQKQIMGDIWSKAGINSSETIDSISAAVLVTNQQKEVMQRVPEKNGQWMNYTWETWEDPIYRKKVWPLEQTII